MLKTIIFDCDGVLFDSRNANIHYYNFLLESFGKNLMDEQEIDYVHVHSVYDSITHIFRHYPKPSLEEIHVFRKSHSYLPFLRYMKMEPDLLPFLTETRGRYNLAIATNRSDTMLPLLEEFGLSEYFGKVMTADNSRKPKPAADPLLEITEFFNCTVEESIYVGDSHIDEKTAENCGMSFIAFKNRQLNATYYVESFSEILNLTPFTVQR